MHRATIELGGGVRREVALKRLLPHLAEDDRFIEDFVREAKLASHLRHPNIIQIYELGRYGGVYFIAMELVRGVSLMSLMRLASRKNTLVPVPAVLSLMLELTDALDHAHTILNEHGEVLGLVHRDLTPSNLLVTDDGHLKIIDFGIAKANRGDLATDSGLAKGKLGYMAIEAIRADPIDGRADLFSAGVVMWELLTGQRLYKPGNEWEQPAAAREARVQRPSAINPRCPPDLDHVVLRAVAKEPEDRWQSAEEMHRALARAARGVPSTANEVVHAKQALRPETSADPYAGFSIEIEIEDDDDAAVAPPSRRLDDSLADGMGRWWPAEPATEPKLRVEGSSVWPVEPPTEEKQYTADQLRAAAGEGTTSWPSEFEVRTTPSAPPFSELAQTKQLRIVANPDPPTQPTKPQKRSKQDTLRKPTRGRAIDAPFEPDQSDRDDTKSFSGEADTIEAKRFDPDD